MHKLQGVENWVAINLENFAEGKDAAGWELALIV